MRYLDENAVASLLETRRHREEPVSAEGWATVMILAYGAPAFLMGLAQRSGTIQAPPGSPILASPLAAYLATAGLLVLVAVPWLAFRVDAELLLSFRRGRCFEELLGTPTTAREVVDGVLLHTTRSLLRLAIPAAAALGPALLLEAPEMQGAWGIAGALWAAGCLATVLVTSVLLLLLASWSERGEELNPLLVGTLLVVGVPAAILVGAAFTRPEGPSGTAGMLLVAGALAWFVAVGRQVALYGFAHFYDLSRAHRRWTRRLAGVGARRTLAWSPNPLVLRECTREARALPAAWPVLLASRHAPALVAAGLLLGPFGLPGGFLEAGERSWLGLLLACGFLALRAAGRTMSAVANEVEGKTWETLVGTRLSLGEFLDAWTQLGWVPRALDGLLVAPLAVGLAWESGLGPGAAVAPLLLVVAPMAGAEAGLSACREGGSRRAAAQVLAQALLVTLLRALGFQVLATLLVGVLQGWFPTVAPVGFLEVLLLSALLQARAMRRSRAGWPGDWRPTGRG